MDRFSLSSDNATPASATAREGAVTPSPQASPREIDSATLMGGQRELFIRHAQDVYRLRVTAQGKLILTK